MRKKILLSLLVACSLCATTMAQPPTQAQDKEQLEKERQDIRKELQDIQNQYDHVKGQTKKSLGQLNMLNRKIALQERYINNVNRELKMIDDDIYKSNLEIYRLQKQMDTLKSQYARTVVYAYTNRSNYDYLNFIFSASSFNDAVKRIGYLQSYRTYREKQVTTILETEQLIAQRKQQQLGRKVQKNEALQDQNKQMDVLSEQRKEKDAVVSGFRSQEKDLEKQIAIKKKRDRDLQNQVAAIVKREIAKETERKNTEARNNAASTNPTTTPVTTPVTSTPNSRINTVVAKPSVNFNTESDLKLNAAFEGNRGRLPWPVDQGFVSVHFGSYKIEGTNLIGNNPGITISTPNAGIAAKSIFDGDVVGIFNMGDGMAVTIRHGKYFTTYSNLSSVSVSKGTVVKTGEAIGKVAADDEGGAGGKIDFILMIETKNVNPELWLHRQ